MKSVLSAVLLLLAATACSPASSADNQALGALQVSEVWAKATPPNAKVAGGYLAVHNSGATQDRLLRVESAAAKRVEIHEMSDVDGVARMRELADGLPLPAGKTRQLKPGGYHLMFIEPAQPFVEGQQVAATLVFEKAGSLPVVFQVRALTHGSGAGHAH